MQRLLIRPHPRPCPHASIPVLTHLISDPAHETACARGAVRGGEGVVFREGGGRTAETAGAEAEEEEDEEQDEGEEEEEEEQQEEDGWAGHAVVVGW